jgi:molybdopterin molybdotransferase
LRNFISWVESQKRLESLKTGITWEVVPLQNSLNRYLAEDIKATENSPAFPTSSLDGFAIRAKEQISEILIFSKDNPAGNSEIPTLPEGFAIKTFTGSIMPVGSDTLIPIENCKEENGKLEIETPVSIGNGVRPVGEVYKSGEVVLKRGTKIGFAEIGVMAELGVVSLKVAKRPRVSILATGSEILSLGEPRTSPSQIRSSNNYTLEALVSKYGGEAIQLGTVGDSKEKILEAMRSADSDFLVTTGGVSVGDYDFVTDVVKELGFELLFHGVKIKPGQHILVAKKENQILLALPGFAYSSTVTAILYLLPLLRYRLGLPFETEFVKAKLEEDFFKRSKKTEFTTCNLRFENSELLVNFRDKKIGTSAILTNMLNSASLLYSPEDSGNAKQGDIVEVLKWTPF